jgi:quinol monooxygenase YgiN
MSELLCIARLKIHPGKLDEFKHLGAECAELVSTKDTGTLQYEQYFNCDKTECLVIERYRDSQALLDHHKNLRKRWPRFFRHALALEKYAERPTWN